MVRFQGFREKGSGPAKDVCCGAYRIAAVGSDRLRSAGALDAGLRALPVEWPTPLNSGRRRARKSGQSSPSRLPCAAGHCAPTHSASIFTATGCGALPPVARIVPLNRVGLLAA